MYKGKIISVAMATYNGERFIEEQLVSICNNTVKPDEIIVSDDGSKDRTLEIVKSVAESDAAKSIEFVVVTDNPNHGFAGNFEWALKHTSGDYIFLSDQDDIWMPEKVQTVIDAFFDLPDAELICHNMKSVNENGIELEVSMYEPFQNEFEENDKNKCFKIEREKHLSDSFSSLIFLGMSQCVSRSFAESILPFPKGVAHDAWITFCSVLDDECYFLDLDLTKRRLHGNNLYGNTAYRGTFSDNVNRKFSHLSKVSSYFLPHYLKEEAVRQRLEEQGFKEDIAYRTILEARSIGEKLYDVETSNRIAGAIKLCRLFKTNEWYRNSGTGQFVYEMVYTLRYSKAHRIEAIRDIR